VWRSIRIFLLLAVLAGVALNAWLDRIGTQSWQEPLWVGLFPLNADGSAPTQDYVAALTMKDFAGIEDFFAREGRRYGLKLEQPVHVELYPLGSKLPPTLDPSAGPLGIAWWSLKLRYFAAQAVQVPGRAPPRIRLFLLYHDPAALERRRIVIKGEHADAGRCPSRHVCGARREPAQLEAPPCDSERSGIGRE